VVAEHKEEKKL